MLFTFDLKDLPLLARVAVYVLLYLEGIYAGLRDILSSLVRMAWGITWPVARLVWPEFRVRTWDQERDPWCEVSYCRHWASKQSPLVLHRSGVDLYVLTWKEWQINIFTSARVDRLISRWVPSA